MKNSIIKNVLWVGVASVALLAAINYEAVLDVVVSRVIVGNEVRWNGHTIKVDDSFKVLWPFNDDSLYIVSRRNRNDFVQFFRQKAILDLKTLMADLCQQEPCSAAKETTYESAGRIARRVDIVRASGNGKRIEIYIVVGDSPIWIRYAGTEAEYERFKSIIDRMVADVKAQP